MRFGFWNEFLHKRGGARISTSCVLDFRTDFRTREAGSGFQLYALWIVERILG